jgi:hypothetical protein
MKTYSNRSNALRAAKTAGYKPDQVEIVPEGNGFIYQPIGGVVASPPVEKPKKPASAKRKPATTKNLVRRSLARSANPTKKAPGGKAKSARAKSGKGGCKGDIVVGMLKKGKGATVQALCKASGWQAHSLRAFLSVQSKKQRWKLKRERVGGVTTYRIAG